MSVAVIIPFWNGSQWVERAIASVCEQTVAPTEFFVVNDGSRPEERAKLTALAMRHGFAILDKANGGQGSARNHGVAHSQSDYICFLDQDDFFLPDHIEKLLAQVPRDQPNFGFVYGSYDLADGDGHIHVKNDLAINHADSHPPSRNPLKIAAKNLSILPSAALISKRAFQAVGGFDCQFKGYEDDDLFSRLILANFDFKFLPESVYIWCQHKGSTTWSPVMARSRFHYYKKIRSAHLIDGYVNSREFANILLDRFGQVFYKSAAAWVGTDNESEPLHLDIFKSYVQDLKFDNVSPQKNNLFKARFWLLRHANSFPLSLILHMKRANRRRINERRLRDGRQFLGDT